MVKTFIALMLMCTSAFATINFDAVVKSSIDQLIGSPNNYEAVRTDNLTISGTDTFLVSSAYFVPSSGNYLSEYGAYIYSWTQNGQDMTFLGYNTVGSWQEHIYYQIGATSGNNVITFHTPGDADDLSLTAEMAHLSFNGVNQSSPIAQSSTTNGSGTLIAYKSISNTINWNLVVDFTGTFTAGLTKGAAQTQRSNNLGGTGASRTRFATSTRPAGSGDLTMLWTLSLAQAWVIYVLELTGTPTYTNINNATIQNATVR